jgi:hypothetical protein
MRFLPFTLLCPLLALGCGSSARKTEEKPQPAPEVVAPQPQALLVKGHVPDAPLAPPKVVFRIARADLPEDVPAADRTGLETVSDHLRAGRGDAAQRTFRSLGVARSGKDATSAAHWVLRATYLAPLGDVMAAALALARHDERRAQLRDEAAQARDVANSLSQGYTIRYERLDPATMTRRAPARMTLEELGVYAGELDTAERKLRDGTSTLRRSFERAMQGHPAEMQQLSNALQLLSQ